MNITLHLDCLTAAQVAAIAAVLDGSAPAAAAPKTAAAKTEPKGETSKAKEEPKSNAAEITVERLTELGKAFAGKNGRDAFVELLGGFGAKNISGVPAEQRTALLAKLEA